MIRWILVRNLLSENENMLKILFGTHTKFRVSCLLPLYPEDCRVLRSGFGVKFSLCCWFWSRVINCVCQFRCSWCLELQRWGCGVGIATGILVVLVVALLVFGGDSGGGQGCGGGRVHGVLGARLTGLTHKYRACSRDSVGKEVVIGYPRMTLTKL